MIFIISNDFLNAKSENKIYKTTLLYFINNVFYVYKCFDSLYTHKAQYFNCIFIKCIIHFLHDFVSICFLKIK